MKRSLLFLCVGVFRAYGAEPADSIRVFPLHEVVVTGSRAHIDANQLPASIEEVSHAELEQMNGSSVADALTGVSGLSVRSYGGGGSLHTISMRGMGPEYTLILIDGQRYSSQQNATADLGIIGTGDIERIEIARGGLSALYGGNAMGGVVNLVTKKPGRELRTDISAGVGSFGFGSCSAAISGGIGEVRTRASFHRETSRENYPFQFLDGNRTVELNRSGADYSLAGGSLRLDAELGLAASTSFSLRYDRAERGAPTAVSNAGASSVSRLLDKDVQAQWSVIWKPEASLLVTLNSSFRNVYERYTDPVLDIGTAGPVSSTVNTVYALNPSLEWKADDDHTVSAGVDMSSASIRGNQLHSAERMQFGMWVSSHHRFPIASDVLEDVTVFPSLRYDHNSDVSGTFSPYIGINVGAGKGAWIHLKSGFGGNFRVPTFNDLYWIAGGNPNLLPERSKNFDIGLQAQLMFLGEWNVEATYYRIDASDKIVWVPGAAGIWTPQNILRVLSTGVESNIAWKLLDGKVCLKFSQTLMSAIRKASSHANDATVGKRLVYVPEQTAAFAATLTTGPAVWTVHHEFSGFRYYTEMNDPSFILPSYQKTDVAVTFAVTAMTVPVTTKMEVGNLFNTDYQLVAGYPMPQRRYALSLGIHF